ncbi:MAG: hypothetical protein A3F46_01195 [Legionellales bacterium RIFCSPHIGHO2_12_FULL_42_9]|nr:MAG: hypothetical protein A3F46_01195 [Legionellales bacterium RIFCSPHIGHO2_12_FULL_42_9]
MLKHFVLKSGLVYILASTLIITFSKEMHWLISMINKIYAQILSLLNPIFKEISIGTNLRQVILLTIIPISIPGIPALIFYLIRKKPMPYFIEATWCFWLVIVLNHMLHT